MTNEKDNVSIANQKWRHHIEEEVSEVKQRLTGVETRLVSIDTGLEKISRQYTDSRNVNWGWLIAGAMLLIAFMTLVTLPIKEDIKQLDEIQQREMRLLDQALQNEFNPRLQDIDGELERIAQHLRQHENIDGHPGMAARVEQVDKRLTKIGG